MHRQSRGVDQIAAPATVPPALAAAAVAAVAVAVAAIALGLALPPTAHAQAGSDSTTLVSRANGTAGAKAIATSEFASISADGRLIAFESNATNLSPLDSDSVSDIYVRDLSTGATILVSRADGAGGAKGDLDSLAPAISANGRYVAFQSSATNLDPADTDTLSDVYVRDLATNTTTLVSRPEGGGPKGNLHSSQASISADGRFVAFESMANNLNIADPDTNRDVYVRDLATGTTHLVSRAGLTGPKGNGNSTGPAISADGRHVAFHSDATNLSPADGEPGLDVYVRDLAAGTTTLVSRASGSGGARGNNASSFADISADGSRIAFSSVATNLSPVDTDPTRDVYVRDLATATTTLASRATGAAGAIGNDRSDRPSLSAGGSRVAFISLATNLVAVPDGPGSFDVFVRDLETETTYLASRATGADGAKGNAPSSFPAISGDGLAVGFHSEATNLSPDDSDPILDVYRRTLPPRPGPAASPPPAGRQDAEVGLIIRAKRKLRLNRKGVARVRIVCPASEASPPCKGRLALRTRGKIAAGKGEPRKLTLARSKPFALAAGEQGRVRLKLSARRLRLIRREPRARNTVLVTKVSDAAGNERQVSKKVRVKR